MKKLLPVLHQFILRNNSWILLAVLVFISFHWVLTFDRYFTSVYLHPVKWHLFFRLMGSLVLIFLPMLAYSLLRDSIESRIGKVPSLVTWITLFIVYPIGVGFAAIADMLPVRMQGEVLSLIGLGLAGSDFVSTRVVSFSLMGKVKSWSQKISLEWGVVGVFVLLSIFTAVQLIRVNNLDAPFVLTVLQAMVPSSILYIFYRINHYYLVDVIYRQKGLIYYVFSFLALMILFFGPLLLAYFVLPAYQSFFKLSLGEYWIGPDAPFTFSSIPLASITGGMMMVIPLTILVQWLIQSQRIVTLQKQKSETELSLLKQQISPHFFFNTLNNIYAMSLTNDPKTEEGILQLSDLMRYVIYQGEKDRVALSEEIKYIEDYLTLHLMRFSQDVDYRFDVDVSDDGTEVAPLLFIILVENAIKHGIENTDHPSTLRVSIHESEGIINLTVYNSVEQGGRHEQAGLGILNLKRRLALLYPDRYELNIESSENHYQVRLSVNTNTNKDI